MKGNYKTKEGTEVEILEFDEANKMVRISSGWVGEPEYKDWESLGIETEEVVEEVENAEEPETEEVEETEEKPKRKRTVKNK